mgnify:CR=1 FL=1|jgi:hypothetical protein
MNKRLFYYLFAVLCTVTLFTSCSDDDDNGKGDDQTEVADISGNYKGNLVVSINEQPADPISQVISITKSGNQTSQVVLSLKNFSFGGQLVGDIEVPCMVEEREGTQSFSGQKNLTFTTPFGQLLGTLPTSVNGTVKDGKISMKIGVTVTAFEQVVDVDFDGNKMTGNESSEAKILDFVIDRDFITEQPVIDDENGTITFKISDTATDDDLKTLIPIFKISDKATVSPVSGVAQNFSGGNSVEYTVIAEDGTIKVYTVSIAGKYNVLKYSFEKWDEVTSATMKWPSPIPFDELATANQGVAYLKAFDSTNKYNLSDGASEEKEAGYKGSAAKLITQYTKGAAFGFAPAITPGSLFTGKFEFKAVLDQKEQLKLTKFGISYTKKPLYFKGAYKYKAGEKFIDGSNKNDVKEDTGDKDQCGIYALLYEAMDKEGNDVILDGSTITNSEYCVAIAQIKDGSDTENKWVEFNEEFIYFDGKTYDSSKKYKMAIVCSSSKAGDSFKGAVNSTLLVDELEIIGE